jgi:hypothetical protein
VHHLLPLSGWTLRAALDRLDRAALDCLECANLFFPTAAFSPNSWSPTLQFLVFALFFGLFVYAQIYRYRCVSNAPQRQQTKWVVFGLSIALTGLLGLGFATEVLFPPLSVVGEVAITAAFYMVLLLFPLTTGIVILKYHLYDIDLLINRTLVDGLLTVILGLVYASSVVVLQYVVRVLTGQGSQLASVEPTLAIAALFTPLRRRLQAGIDRRFYRRKYDAAKMLTAFSIKMRDKVDLRVLTEDLLIVIAETMQPEQVTLWVCTPLRRPQPATTGRAQSAYTWTALRRCKTQGCWPSGSGHALELHQWVQAIQQSLSRIRHYHDLLTERWPVTQSLSKIV